MHSHTEIRDGWGEGRRWVIRAAHDRASPLRTEDRGKGRSEHAKVVYGITQKGRRRRRRRRQRRRRRRRRPSSGPRSRCHRPRRLQSLQINAKKSIGLPTRCIVNGQEACVGGGKPRSLRLCESTSLSTSALARRTQCKASAKITLRTETIAGLIFGGLSGLTQGSGTSSFCSPENFYF